MKLSIAHAIDGEYIREWLVLGPFFPGTPDTDFLADVGGEADIEPMEGDSVTTEDGRTLTWQRCKSMTDIVHLCDYIGRHQNATVYAFCILQSEIAGDVEICFASNVDVKLWIKQESFHHNPAYHHHHTLDQCILYVELQEGANRCLVKLYTGMILNSRGSRGSFAARVLPPCRAIISGTVTDEQGRSVPNAIVRLQQNGEEITRTRSDDSGSYHLGVYPVDGSYDLSANSVVRHIRESPYEDMLGDLGDSRSDMHLCKYERQEIHFTLKKVISIEGTLLMLDGMTPHGDIPVQAVMIDNDYPTERLMATRFSDERGQYQFANLKPGSYQVRCQVPGGYIYYGTGQVEKPEKLEAGGLENGTGQPRSLQVGSDTTCSNINFRFAPFKKGIWRSYTYFDGLAGNSVFAVHGDPDGAIWFGTLDSGVSRYDGKEFVNFTREDGLPSNGVLAIHREPDGTMWFGTRKGVSRYDGKEFINFAKEDGLVSNIVNDIYCDPNGNMWFAAGNPIGEGIGGISCYDGKEFTHFSIFSIDDGLSKFVFAIYHAPDGVMWFGTFGGLFRYDGEEFVKFTLSDEWKRDFVFCIHHAPDGALWFGTFGNGVYRYDGREIVNYTIADGLANNTVGAINTDSNGFLWFGTGWLWGVVGNGVSRYDGKTFVTFTTEEGLVNNTVRAIYSDPDGALWFGTDGGVSRYHDGAFVNLTTKDGLAGNTVKSIYSDPDGTLWIGTNGGVSRYSGGAFINLTEEDGLTNNSVEFILRAPDGNLWFGTRWKGISRYDGKSFTNFITGDTMLDQVWAGHSDPDGTMWFGTGGGLCRYDGKGFVNFTTKDGLLDNWVYCIHRDPDGTLWLGTRHGISCYDGTEFVNLTEEDGLPDAYIYAIYRAPDGVMWFGTGGGVSRYDGETFTNFTTRDGLPRNGVSAIHRAPDGVMWFGTRAGGVSMYDGTAWTSLDTRDGLAGNGITSIHQDKEGFLWFGTDEGITRYRPGTTSPGVYIASVTTDQTYRDLSAIPAFTPDTRVTIEYGSIDFRTVPEKRQYRYRIREIDSDWHKPTKSDTFDYVFDEPGTYTFEVQSIDRDLNYSEPASVKLEVIPDPRNHQIAQLKGELAERERAELERVHQELEDARQIQQSLLPEKPPKVEGFEIAGTSLPAREVSGDFYSYLSLGDNTGIVLADVTGKSVKAAMVAALANGMLNEATKSRRELWNSPGMILRELNVGLRPRLIRGMYTAMSLGIIQPEKKLIFSNAGMPYPIVKRGKEAWERKVVGMPLGLMSGAEYEDLSIDLETGDLVIFCSDGVIEATNEADEMYQTERLLEVVKQAELDISAQEMVDLIVHDVTEFTGDVELSDDITIVVLRCKK